jgi:hypothetical protein
MPGTVIVDGAGTKSSPQLIEVMVTDADNVAAGYASHFAYNVLELGIGTYVQFVNQASNSGGTTEAAYAAMLVRDAGSTYDENGLHLYYQSVSPSTIGLYAPAASKFYLRNTNSSGYADVTFEYGLGSSGWVTIAGDWDGDGVDTVGLYNPATSTFYLRNDNSSGYADAAFMYGPGGAGWTPIAGDWDGDGVDTVGLYNPATSVFYLRNSNTSGYANVSFEYGPANAGWTPIVGHWTGTLDTIGLYNSQTSTFYLRNSNTSGYADTVFAYGSGNVGWKPITGDWTGSGYDTIGLYDPAESKFLLRNSNTNGYADAIFNYGPGHAGWLPIAGDWNGSAKALKAAGGAVTPSADATTLAEADLQPIVAEAIARWAAAGLNAETVAKLQQVRFVIGDLTGSTLGDAEGNRVQLDINAAGHGWFIDQTPALDEEFVSSAGTTGQTAVDARAVDQIDLLTVVEHELGHIAGFDDLDALTDNVMSGELGVGIRRGF